MSPFASCRIAGPIHHSPDDIAGATASFRVELDAAQLRRVALTTQSESNLNRSHLMQYRSLGTTGLTVSEVSMGCNRLGETGMPDSHWVDLVRHAVELGVSLFDTSESYGWGRSEEILGLAVGKGSGIDPAKAQIASKVSRVQQTNAKDFSSARVLTQVEATLRRIRREFVDVYQLHSPNLRDLQSYDWPEAMARLKSQGKIRLAGVSINDAESGRWLIDNGLADVLQVAYNILEPEVGRVVLPLARAKGVGILVRMPMAQGILTGKFEPGQDIARGHRALLAGERMASLVEKALTLRPIADGTSFSLGQIAIQYALADPTVSCAIPGARTRDQLEQNVVAGTGVPLDSALMARIEAIQSAWG
jgi:aryl-alcohol dehydrogenase-like predicted oxidoreductase